jgi:hypothetical protein
MELEVAYFVRPKNKKGTTLIHALRKDEDKDMALCGFTPKIGYRRIRLDLRSEVTCGKCLNSVEGRDLFSNGVFIVLEKHSFPLVNNNKEHENRSTGEGQAPAIAGLGRHHEQLG